MGTQEELHSAAPRSEALCIERRRERRCLHENEEVVNLHTLLSVFKDGAEQIGLD
jgi:hypothetical protein